MRRAALQLDGERPDLTPMIDVVFLLLVFFLVTLQFRVLEGKLPTHLPRDRGPSAQPLPDLIEPLPIRVESVKGVARVRVGHRPWGTAVTLVPLVRAALAEAPDLRARISVGPDVDYGQAVEVVDACVTAGLRDIGFAGT